MMYIIVAKVVTPAIISRHGVLPRSSMAKRRSSQPPRHEPLSRKRLRDDHLRHPPFIRIPPKA